MYFFSNWILIVFEFGGLAAVIMTLCKIKRLQGTKPTVDLNLFGSAMKLLIAFVILATVSLSNVMIKCLAESGLLAQLINNLTMGIIFILSILKLNKSIQPMN